MEEGEMRRHVAHTGDMVNGHKILVRKLEGKGPLWRSRHKWEDKIVVFQSCISSAFLHKMLIRCDVARNKLANLVS
jgi:hypothetical protein